MSKLFEASEINGMKLSNRFVRSATWEGWQLMTAPAPPKLIDMMAALAEGGVGLIITSHAYVSPEGQAGPWQLGVYQDELVPGLESMAKAVHEKGWKNRHAAGPRRLFFLCQTDRPDPDGTVRGRWICQRASPGNDGSKISSKW